MELSRDSKASLLASCTPEELAAALAAKEAETARDRINVLGDLDDINCTGLAITFDDSEHVCFSLYGDKLGSTYFTADDLRELSTRIMDIAALLDE